MGIQIIVKCIHHQTNNNNLKNYTLLSLSLYLLLSSCNNGKEQIANEVIKKDPAATAIKATIPGAIKRVGMITGLKPDKIAYYKNLHANPWPAVLEKLEECNIHNYSIYLQQIDNKYYLFSYFDYTGTNYDADMKNMAADTSTQRWWKETNPTQIPLPEAVAKRQIWTIMESVFHTN